MSPQRAARVSWERVSDVISSSMGLHFPPARWKDLERGLEGAARELGLADAAACAARLLESTPTREQLRVLASHLTIGETYFFRDTRLFEALRGSLLPDLIAARRTRRDHRLRLWSAGCCTGEEAYSLAILLHELLPDIAQWHVTLMATDVNPRFLQKAHAGVYGEWSFRGVPDAMRRRYFRATDDGRFALRGEIKRLVTFAQLNLVQDLFPSITSDTNAMDVIFCRNVLMYFTPEHMQAVVEKLRLALLPGGWLVVSPSEAAQSLFPGLSQVSYPGAILYRREKPAAATPRPAPAPPPAVVVPMRESTPPVRAAAAPAPAERPRTPDFAGSARACANQGALDQALEWCDKWVAAAKLDPAAHYLRAMVLLEQGEPSQAALALQRTVYLEPAYAMAHVSWGNLAHTQGLEGEARRHYLDALRVVQAMEPDDPVADSDGLTAGRLAETLAALTTTERTT